MKVDVKKNTRRFLSLIKKYKSILATILLVILIVETTYVAEKYLFKILIDDGADKLLIIGLIFAAMIITRTVLKFVQIHLLNKMDASLIYDMKEKFFNHILTLSHNFHANNKTGSMISKLSRGGRSIEALVDVIVFNVAPMIFLFLITVVWLLTISVPAVLAAVAMVVTFIAYGIYIQRKQLPHNMLANDAEDTEKASMADFLTNIETIKYYGQEQAIIEEYRLLNKQTKDRYLKHWSYFRYLDAGQSLILGLGLVGMIIIPLLEFQAGNITVGEITFIYTVYATLLGPLFGFMHGIRQFTRSIADFESLFQYDEFENDIKDGSKDLKVTKGEVEFRNVTFGYNTNNIFEGFSLVIQQNQKVAFVGHSGSGKSTLVKLLYRLYDLKSGAILIDGTNIKDVKQEGLRSELAIVSQEPILFDDTIENNIRFANKNATKKEVAQAMRFAQLDKVIKQLPDKEKTIVGERGVKLSGGEKQRVSIARALLANKKILVLDEATSALDSHTEHEIQKDLEKLMQGRTSIIIAHRLSTIMHADVIVVLDEGKIVEQGTHKQLIKQSGAYKKLWSMQKGGFV